MNLLLLRHARAERPDPAVYPDDDLRPLTEAGVKRHRRVSKVFHAMGIRPDRIITSPRLRARQTAEITAAVLGLEERLVQNVVLGAEYSLHAVLEMLAICDPKEMVMLVGHEPDLGVLAGQLLGPNAGPTVRFRKGALLGLSFPGIPQPGSGVLAFFYRPDDLLALS